MLVNAITCLHVSHHQLRLSLLLGVKCYWDVPVFDCFVDSIRELVWRYLRRVCVGCILSIAFQKVPTSLGSGNRSFAWRLRWYVARKLFPNKYCPYNILKWSCSTLSAYFCVSLIKARNKGAILNFYFIFIILFARRICTSSLSPNTHWYVV